MKRLQTIFPALALALVFSACDTVSELTGTDSGSPTLTEAALRGKVLSFTPEDPTGGIRNWEYEFNAGEVKGCNVENVYHSTGWQVVDDHTVRVIFGGQWEQYELVSFQGSLSDGNLSGRFNYTSSPGVSMTGTFVQMSSTMWC